MTIDLSKLSAPLPLSSIDFRVQSVNKGGYATILAYKDARVDMQRLDEVCGALNWKREHSRDNANCTVSIWDESKNQWVSKEDTGTEANTEKEKSIASDSFKRSCTNWGIGRELYDYPLIQIKLESDEWQTNQKTGKPQTTWQFKLKEWKWYGEFEGNKISFLAAQDEKGKTRFQWGTMKQKTQN